MSRSSTVRLIAITAVVLFLVGIANAGILVASFLAKVALAVTVVVLLAWLLARAYQAFLWKVGRRLAFSYFLIGVVPIPMVVLLAAGVAWVLSTFLLGFIYSNAFEDFQDDQVRVAETALEGLIATGKPGASDGAGFALDYYRKSKWLGGTGQAPANWPVWLTEPPAGTADDASDRVARFVKLPTGKPTIAVAVQQGDFGVVAVYPGDLEAEMRRRASAWVRLVEADEDEGADENADETEVRSTATGVATESAAPAPGEAQSASAEPSPPDDTSQAGSKRRSGGNTVTIEGQTFRFGRPAKTGSEEAEEEARMTAAKKAFFDAQALASSKSPRSKSGGTALWDLPLINWLKVEGPIFDLATGKVANPNLFSGVQATPRRIARQLFAARQSELNGALWASLGAVTIFLSAVYALAVIVAAYMIFGLSRAVNRLSSATGAVQAGNFSVRIPVQRKDQVGALQRSFNQMAENLQGLVATAAQKEVLEKELQIAREIQESLLPTDLPQGEGVEFATVFEPSAAIGGDYFDILRLDQHRLAVVIADVSGHGLPSGLRMAMLKAGLQILIEQEHDATKILERLDTLVRSHTDKRFFVTATLSMLDLKTGRLELTNAGHPPAYLLRGGVVHELGYPGTPLGTLGKTYGHGEVDLEPGDFVLWLSDGLIEALDPSGDPFGYERLVAALEGPTQSPANVRNRLLAAIERHAQGVPATDDRTLVVMAYQA